MDMLKPADEAETVSTQMVLRVALGGAGTTLEVFWNF